MRVKRTPVRDPAQKPLKIWAVWAVFQQDLSGLSGLGGLGGFFGKTAQTAQILLKKPLKNRSFHAVIFERFFKQDLSGFWAVFERFLYPTPTNVYYNPPPTCPPPNVYPPPTYLPPSPQRTPPQRIHTPPPNVSTPPPPPTYPSPTTVCFERQWVRLAIESAEVCVCVWLWRAYCRDWQ